MRSHRDLGVTRAAAAAAAVAAAGGVPSRVAGWRGMAAAAAGGRLGVAGAWGPRGGPSCRRCSWRGCCLERACIEV